MSTTAFAPSDLALSWNEISAESAAQRHASSSALPTPLVFLFETSLSFFSSTFGVFCPAR
ncbi:hypothetical protein D3C71_2086430 [compost metagenome]